MITVARNGASYVIRDENGQSFFGQEAPKETWFRVTRSINASAHNRYRIRSGKLLHFRLTSSGWRFILKVDDTLYLSFHPMHVLGIVLGVNRHMTEKSRANQPVPIHVGEVAQVKVLGGKPTLCKDDAPVMKEHGTLFRLHNEVRVGKGEVVYHFKPGDVFSLERRVAPGKERGGPVWELMHVVKDIRRKRFSVTKLEGAVLVRL